jgi:hypothetical protein
MGYVFWDGRRVRGVLAVKRFTNDLVMHRWLGWVLLRVSWNWVGRLGWAHGMIPLLRFISFHYFYHRMGLSAADNLA